MINPLELLKVSFLDQQQTITSQLVRNAEILNMSQMC